MENGRFHMYYGSKQYAKNGVTYAKLDVDDTSGYGPEKPLHHLNC